MLTLFSYFIALSIIPSALHYDANEVFVTLFKFAFLLMLVSFYTFHYHNFL